MEVLKTKIEGLLIIKPRVFSDNRGYFFESYNKSNYEKHGIHADFVQDNQSFSNKGTVRGLHFQKDPFAQGKLVRVIAGRVLDVAVDIRKNSPTYGEHVSVELSAENQVQFWVPPGFAHGFSVLEDSSIFAYKCSNVYSKESEGGLLWNDPKLGIDWKLGDSKAEVSEKDLELPSFNDFVSPF